MGHGVYSRCPFVIDWNRFRQCNHIALLRYLATKPIEYICINKTRFSSLTQTIRCKPRDTLGQLFLAVKYRLDSSWTLYPKVSRRTLVISYRGSETTHFMAAHQPVGPANTLTCEREDSHFFTCLSQTSKVYTETTCLATSRRPVYGCI